jgi:predicted  nucleic acid-binding Zn-ribbon protein
MELSFSSQGAFSPVEEHRLIHWSGVEGPKPTEPPPEAKAEKKEGAEKPGVRVTVEVGGVERAAAGQVAELEKQVAQLRKEVDAARALLKGEKPADAKTSLPHDLINPKGELETDFKKVWEGKSPEAEKKDPQKSAEQKPEKKTETYEERLQREIKKAREEGEQARERGDKQGQIMAAFKYFALNLALVVSYFKGTALNEVEVKDKKLAAKGEGKPEKSSREVVPGEPEVNPSEDLFEAVRRDVRAINPRPMAPGEVADVMRTISEQTSERQRANTTAIEALRGQNTTLETNQRQLRTQKGSLEGQLGRETDSTKKEALTRQIGEVTRQLEIIQRTITANNQQIDRLTKENTFLRKKSDATREISGALRMSQRMIDMIPRAGAEPRLAEKPVTVDADFNTILNFATPEGRNMVRRIVGGEPGENNTLVFTAERCEAIYRELVERARQVKGIREGSRRGSMFGGK